MLRASQAAASMLSCPTPRLPTTVQRARAASNAPRTCVRLRTIIASAVAASAVMRRVSLVTMGMVDMVKGSSDQRWVLMFRTGRARPS